MSASIAWIEVAIAPKSFGDVQHPIAGMKDGPRVAIQAGEDGPLRATVQPPKRRLGAIAGRGGRTMDPIAVAFEPIGKPTGRRPIAWARAVILDLQIAPARNGGALWA